MNSGYRNFIVSIIVAVLTMVATTCFAKVSMGDLNIGGIYFGQPWSEVVAQYGQPIRKESVAPKGYWDVFQYKNSTFMVLKSKKETVVKMVTTDGCPLFTKAGIGPGSTLSDIKSAYGEPDKLITLDAYKYITVTYIADRLENGSEYQLNFYLDRNSGTVKFMGFEIAFIMP